MTLSIIIPTYKEEAQIADTLTRVSRLFHENTQVIVVDSSPDNATINIAKTFDVTTIKSDTQYRAYQLNLGAQHAKGDWLLFLHADTRLPNHAHSLIKLATSNPQAGYGAFCKRFFPTTFILAILSRLNNLRTTLFHSILGDNAMFVRTDVFKATGGFPDIKLMEDLEFSRTLKQYCRANTLRFTLIPECVYTSSRHFLTYGIVRSIVFMQYIRLLHAFGVSEDNLRQKYYRYGKSKK